MMNSESKNILMLLAENSKKINKNIEHLNNKISNEREFETRIKEIYSESVISVIYSDFEGNNKVIDTFSSYYVSTLGSIFENIDRDSSHQNVKFRSMQSIVSITYILIAYLLRNKDIENAKVVLSRGKNDLMRNNYLARAVLTLSARAGVPSSYKGWYIGEAVAIWENDENLKSIFFSNKKDTLMYLCQVDFLQYYLEYLNERDVYSGYPSFLFYPKSEVEPFINMLKTKSEHKDVSYAIDSLVDELTRLNAGEFFTNNKWK